uniref:Uncharacterized protein n=1 Tax=Glossina austeni TaxID=7395 RepID=A0A1A9UPE6_GLOAU
MLLNVGERKGWPGINWGRKISKKPVSTKADLLAQQKLSEGLIEVLLRFGANGGGGLNAPHGPTLPSFGTIFGVGVGVGIGVGIGVGVGVESTIDFGFTFSCEATSNFGCSFTLSMASVFSSILSASTTWSHCVYDTMFEPITGSRGQLSVNRLYLALYLYLVNKYRMRD